VDRKDLELENAKIFFAFAQIGIILAGFLFAVYGLELTNSQNSSISAINTEYDAISINNFAISNAQQIATYNLTGNYYNLTVEYNNLEKDLSALSKSNSDYSRNCLYIAVFFVILSLLTFLIGVYKISKIKADY
jgi:hypothetical protein